MQFPLSVFVFIPRTRSELASIWHTFAFLFHTRTSLISASGHVRLLIIASCHTLGPARSKSVDIGTHHICLFSRSPEHVFALHAGHSVGVQ